MILKFSIFSGNIKGLHPLIFVFRALDSRLRSPAASYLTTSLQTIQPFHSKLYPKKIYKKNSIFETSFNRKKHIISVSKISFFNGIQFKNRQRYGLLKILQKFKNIVLNGHLIIKSIFVFLLLSEPNELNLTRRTIEQSQISISIRSLNK